MTFLTRAFISIIRSKLQTGLICLIFTVSILFIIFGSSISIYARTIGQNLLSNYPAVVTISPFDVNSETQPLTLELIEEIANLPGVTSSDVNLLGNVITRNLKPVFFPTLSENQETYIDIYDLKQSIFISEEDFVHLDLHGLQNPNLIDLQTGIISLRNGRLFTPQEISSGENVVIISANFALENNLDVGSILTLESNVFDHRELGSNWWRGINSLDSLFWTKTIDLNVIGIFDIEMEFDYINDKMGASIRDFNLQNRIYLPNLLVENVINQTNYNLQLVDQTPPHYSALISIFMLKDHSYTYSFKDLANQILPTPFELIDLSISVNHLLVAQEDIAINILLFKILSILCCSILIFIVMYYFISNRKKEIGIYRALGEKIKIIKLQMIIEIFIISTTSIFFAFGSFIIFNSHIDSFLSNEVIKSLAHFDMVGNRINSYIYIPQQLSYFIGGSQHQLPMNDIIENINFSLSITMIIQIMLSTFILIILSSIIILILIIRLKPKTILESY